MRPDRVVIGADSDQAIAILKDLYKPLYIIETPIVITSIESSEMIKYASNAFLATKISYINEIANLCEACGADVKVVAKAMGLDKRIGGKFLHAGVGYGGSCFPKDVQALARSAKNVGYEAALLNAVEDVNLRQKRRIFEKLDAHYEGRLKDKTIALWGLSFKPRTDDMREAPSRVLMEALWEAGATVHAYDPEAMEEAERIYPSEGRLKLCEAAYGALDGADALVIITEWQEFRSPDFAEIKDKLTDGVIFDGRNLYEPDMVENFGLQYYAIGRGRT
jgi:UDPglucose 6-dehydrogenase